MDISQTKTTEARRMIVLGAVSKTRRKGYKRQGDEPEWWKDILIKLHQDGLIYPIPNQGTEWDWFLTDEGRDKLSRARRK